MSTETATGVVALNREWGEVGERFACEQYGLAHADDPRSPDWYDAVTTAPVRTDPTPTNEGRYLLHPAAPVDVKMACFRQADGASTRRGRIWLRRKNHVELQEAGGAYVVMVYRPPPDADEEDVEAEYVLASKAVPAFVVDGVISSWVSAGFGHNVDECTKVSWRHFFADEEVT